MKRGRLGEKEMSSAEAQADGLSHTATEDRSCVGRRGGECNHRVVSDARVERVAGRGIALAETIANDRRGVAVEGSH